MADYFIRIGWFWKFASPFFEILDDRLETNIGGISLSNPVGLAAGYDKNCSLLKSFLHMGFGYVVGGTVLYSANSGNPKPRLLRLNSNSALLNSLGFPSKGSDYARNMISGYIPLNKPVIISIAGLTIDEFTKCHNLIEPFVSGIELNISSPNTKGLKVFQQPEIFKKLLNKVNQKRRKPIFVKLPPIFDNKTMEVTLDLINVCTESGVDGITAINTKPTNDERLKIGSGGLSGRPIFPHMIETVRLCRQVAGRNLSINACGGIFSAEDAWKAFEAGANSIQVLTGLIYEGPSIAKKINKGLIEIIEKKGIPSLMAYISNRP